ncbi:MAG TPA: Fis family transcriptional regulator, partial [Anaeromyxobacteraceae bacterium]|nr:Fis family transcriptional regulator [Anaeromyxobacteraceae bacterium]
MAEIDDELVARALRWCAEAGRHAAAGEVRAALAPLSWDELLAARALLADPPPARPLGPHALADLARGALPDVAAEREREGRYGPAPEAPLPSPPEDA